MGVAYTDDGQPFGGRGGALFNGGGTTVLKGQAFFKKNVGGLVRRTERARERGGGVIAEF